MYGILILCFVSIVLANIPSRIPEGYEPFGTKRTFDGKATFYLISKQNVTWHNARNSCHSTGQYKLVSIENENAAREIYSFMASGAHREAWTSGNDLLRNGMYEWLELNNKPFGEFQDWRTESAPNNPECQCVSVSALAGQCGPQCIGTWGWDEEDCGLKKYAICEYDDC